MGNVDRRKVLATGAGAIAAATMAGSWPAALARRETIVDRDDLLSVFADAGRGGADAGVSGDRTGAFCLFDGASETITFVGRGRATTRVAPASTFKVPNALIALETGAVRDEYEIIPYGGKPQPFPQWQQNMPLTAAVPASNVPVFQEVARRVGIDRYRAWLDKLDYGSAETGTIVDRFWLDGPLAISPVEQAVFLDRLARRELPLSRRAQDTVASICRLEVRDGRSLHGKTGWLTSVTPNIGWWVGWIEGGPPGTNPSGACGFALTIDMPTVTEAPKRIAIGRALLDRLGAWPA